jgi:glycosyltransferase involved in cell wall biosynthesis
MLVSASKYFRDASIRSIVVGQGDDNPYATELREAGYEVRVLTRRIRSPRSMRELIALIRSENVTAVNIHTEGNYLLSALVVLWALRGRRRNVVRTIHNVFRARGRWHFTRYVQSMIADRLVGSLVAPSEDVAQHEFARYRRRPEVIYNWVDDKFFQLREERLANQGENSVPIVAIVGNCSVVKNHAQALRGFAGTPFDLIHIGDETNSTSEEAELLESLSKSGRIVRRGVQSPIESLKIADLYIMPSLNEGMPVALAEALVAGLPCVVSDAPGLRWASTFSQVRVIPLGEEHWAEHLQAVLSNRSKSETGSSLPIDFSARRGVSEYLAKYGVVHSDLLA